MRAFELAVFAYLLNSLWQVPILFAGAWCAARLLRPVSHPLLHRVWVCALFVQIALPGFGFSLPSCLAALRTTLRPATAGAGSVATFSGPAYAVTTGFHVPPQAVLTAIVSGYLMLCAYLVIRLFYRCGMTISLVRSMHPAILPPDFLELVSRAQQKTKFRLGLTNKLVGPANVGHILLLPPAVFEGITRSEFEAVLAHEIAHIQRGDFVKNLVYEVIVLPLLWHPLVLLTRARLAESREVVCDELAAEATGSRIGYARALLRLAKHVGDLQPFANLHAIGMLDANTLERRLMNLTTTPPRPTRSKTLLILTASITLALATTASALALHVSPRFRQTAASTPVSVEARIMAGESIHRQMPVYPASGKANKVDGAVILAAIIGTDGSIKHLEISKSLREDYDSSALDAVKNWKYKPYMLNGSPVEVSTTITITYTAPGPETLEK